MSEIPQYIVLHNFGEEFDGKYLLAGTNAGKPFFTKNNKYYVIYHEKYYRYSNSPEYWLIKKYQYGEEIPIEIPICRTFCDDFQGCWYDASIHNTIPSSKLNVIVNDEESSSSSSSIDSSSSSSSTSSSSSSLDSSSSSSSSSEAFNPLDYSNLSAWYNASDTSSINLSAGNSITRWDDLSGNNFHLEQTNTNQQPTIITNAINGISGVYFDGIDDIFTTLNGNPLGTVGNTTSDLALFFVGEALDVNTKGDLFHQKNNEFRSESPDNNGKVTFSVGGTQILSTNTWANENEIVQSLYYVSPTESKQQIWKNGSILAQGFTGPTTTVSSTLDIGGGHNYRKIILGEIIIVKGVLSESYKHKVEGYFAHKWGIADKLPIGHPYKNVTP